MQTMEDSPLVATPPIHYESCDANRRSASSSTATSPLYRLTCLAWFTMSFFGLYALFQYIVPYFRNDVERWDKTNSGLYRRGNLPANALMVTHLTCGVLVSFAGPVQLIPAIRRRYLAVHQWTGRVYIAVGLILSSCMLFYIPIYRTSRRWFHEDLGNFLFAAAAFVAAIQSYRYVKLGDIDNHKLWSWRLFAVFYGASWYRLYGGPMFVIDSWTGARKFLINLSFYLIWIPSWFVVELIYIYGWKPSPRTISLSFWVLLVLLLVAMAFIWVPAMFDLPTLQARFLDPYASKSHDE